jgi:proteasome lid subunit RPN8/RPN11
MKIRFKITSALLTTIRTDLRRPHPFAHERVGFVAAGLAAAHDGLLILAREYRAVRDEEYLPEPSVGAMMSADAIRRARQWAMDERVAIFHVHTHGGNGIPGFSGTDSRENAKFIPNFVSVAPHSVHGAVVLSDTAAFGQVWLGRKSPQPFIGHFSEVGAPIRNWRAA